MERSTWTTAIYVVMVLLGVVQVWLGLSGDTPGYAVFGVVYAALGGLFYWAEVHRPAA